MQLASQEKQVLLHWHCMNCISFFTNVVQPNVEKTRFGKSNLFAEMYYDRILNITRICTLYNICHIHIFVFVGTYSCEENSLYNDLLERY